MAGEEISKEDFEEDTQLIEMLYSENKQLRHLLMIEADMDQLEEIDLQIE
jgi:hypothetical protein